MAQIMLVADARSTGSAPTVGRTRGLPSGVATRPPPATTAATVGRARTPPIHAPPCAQTALLNAYDRLSKPCLPTPTTARGG